MNISHRSIWNAALGAWVAVSEITRASGKRTLRRIAARPTPPNGRRRPLNTALILAGLLAASGSVIAQTSHWVTAGPGDWNVGGNWSGGSTPTGARDVILDRGGATATLSAAGTAKTLYVYNSDEVIVTTGGTLVVGDIISLGTVAGAGTARLTIQAGGTVSAARLYAGDEARQGIVTVTGTGSRLTVTPVPGEFFTIGAGGAGELHIDAGANVTVNGSRTLHLGRAGDGTLFIGSGAGAGTLTADAVVFRTAGSSVQFNHTGATTFAAAISGDGFLTKTGTGTTTLTGANSYTGDTSVESGTLAVSGAGTLGTATNNIMVGTAASAASFNVLTGGKITSGLTILGQVAGSTGNATVSGTGASWINGGDLTVGSAGSATLSVASAGKVESANTSIGDLAGAVGVVEVSGAASALSNSGALTVGYDGTGTLNISSEGQVSAGQTIIGRVTGPGTVTVKDAGSLLSMTGELTVASQSSGTLNIENGAKVVSGKSVVGEEAGAVGAVNFSGASSTWQTSGLLWIGDKGTGTVTVDGGGKLISSAMLSLGQSATGEGKLVVQGADSTVTQSAQMLVGDAGKGTLEVKNSAQVNVATHSYVGMNAGAVGIATVAGGGAWRMGGDLEVGTRGTGTLTIDAGGTVAVNEALVLANNAGSQGTLNLNTGGTLTLGGTGALVGDGLRAGAGTAAFNWAGGTLKVVDRNLTTAINAALGNGAGDASIIDTNGFNAALSGVLANAPAATGSLRKSGSGTLTLSGTNTYTGATTINGGTLAVNGSIASSVVTVNSGGVLGGSGTVGTTTVAAGGALAPGNSIGTLNVAGNLSFAPGSSYRVEVDALGANDRTNVTGTAALNGTVAVQAAAGTYAANTTYTLLNAGGGLSGSFTGVSSDLAFLTPTLGYDTNNVFLTLARNDLSFAAVALTPNQNATAGALQNATAGVTGDMATVLNTLTGLSAPQARAAYDAASGAGLVALRRTGSSFAATLNNQMFNRLNPAQGAANALANRPILLAANSHGSDLSGLLTTMSDAPVQQFSLAGGAPLPSASASQGRGFWLRGSGGHQDTKTDGNAAASELRNTALSAGFDTQLQEGLVVGAALSSGTSRLSLNRNDAGKSRGSALAVYGSYASGPWAFKASASAGWNDNHMDRTVTVGALSRTARSDFNSRTLSAYGEAQYSIPMSGWTLQPVAGLSISRDKADGFTETGAGALNLQVAGQSVTSTKSLLGARASFEAGKLSIEPRAIWAHEFGDLNTPMTAQFQGAASASPFQVSGVALKRDTLILGLGASGSISKNFDLFADVQLEHNSRQRNAGVMVGLRASW